MGPHVCIHSCIHSFTKTDAVLGQTPAQVHTEATSWLSPSWHSAGRHGTCLVMSAQTHASPSYDPVSTLFEQSRIQGKAMCTALWQCLNRDH